MTKSPIISVCRDILSRYNEMSSDFPEQYDKDVRRIVSAFFKVTSRERKKLIEQLRQAYWVPSRNARTGDLTLFFPDNNLYLPNHKLQTLYHDEGRLWFVDLTRPSFQDKRIQAVLAACGVATFLRRAEAACELMLEKQEEMRAIAGLPRSTRSQWRDYEIPHLEKLLQRIGQSVVGWQVRSWLLWDCLHDAFNHHGADFFFGEYKWWYGRKSRSVSFPAIFLRHLRISAWLPGSDGKPMSPSQLCYGELPGEYRKQANPLIVQLLSFKSKDLQQRSEKAGIKQKFLDILREQDASTDDLRKQLLLRERQAIEAQHAEISSRDGYQAEYKLLRDPKAALPTHVSVAAKQHGKRAAPTGTGTKGGLPRKSDASSTNTARRRERK